MSLRTLEIKYNINNFFNVRIINYLFKQDQASNNAYLCRNNL